MGLKERPKINYHANSFSREAAQNIETLEVVCMGK